MTLAQIPGAQEAVEAAASRGWEAVVLVMVLVAILTFGGWLLRHIMTEAREREQRLATRINQLEDVIRGELFSVLRQNSEIMGKVLAAADGIIRAAHEMTETMQRFTSILDVRPCLLPIAEQTRLELIAQKKAARKEGGSE